MHCIERDTDPWRLRQSVHRLTQRIRLRQLPYTMNPFAADCSEKCLMARISKHISIFSYVVHKCTNYNQLTGEPYYNYLVTIIK